MIIDSGLQTLPFQQHLGGTNGVGGVAPTTYGVDAAFPYLGTRFFCGGVAYASILNYLSRPILPNTGKCSLSFTLMPDANVASTAQALEFDSRFSDAAGFNYNCSFQWNVATGQLQISNAVGDWVNMGATLPVLSSAPHTFKLDYLLDWAKQTYSTAAITIDKKVSVVPASLQNLPALKLGWTEGVILQVQLDVNGKGGTISEFVNNIQYEWS